MKQKSIESPKKNTVKRVLLAALLVAPVVATLVYTPVFAEECKTGILPDTWCGEDGMKQMIIDVIKIISALVWVLGAIFITICGVIWMTAADDPGKVATAKKRILEISIGMIFFLAIDIVAYLLGIGG